MQVFETFCHLAEDEFRDFLFITFAFASEIGLLQLFISINFVQDKVIDRLVRGEDEIFGIFFATFDDGA